MEAFETLDVVKVIDVLRGFSSAEYGFVARFSRETGIRDDKIYQWLRGRGTPKVNDMKTIANWFDKNKVMYSTTTVSDQKVMRPAAKNDSDKRLEALEKEVADLKAKLDLIIQMIRK